MHCLHSHQVNAKHKADCGYCLYLCNSGGDNCGWELENFRTAGVHNMDRRSISWGVLWRTSMEAVIVNLGFVVLHRVLSRHSQNKRSESLCKGKEGKASAKYCHPAAAFWWATANFGVKLEENNFLQSSVLCLPLQSRVHKMRTMSWLTAGERWVPTLGKLGLLAASPKLKHLKPPAVSESLDGSLPKEQGKASLATVSCETGEPTASDFYTFERVNAEVLYCINDGCLFAEPVGLFQGPLKTMSAVRLFCLITPRQGC